MLMHYFQYAHQNIIRGICITFNRFNNFPDSRFKSQVHSPVLTLIQAAGGIYDFRNFEKV
jgi:hypothetical protein